MMVYTCTDFKGHYPVGTCAVVVAPSRKTAAKLLREELAKIGLEQEPGWEPELVTVPTRAANVMILRDGNY